MDRLLFARQKLAQIKDEIARVRTSDFHHPGVKRVLDTIEHSVFDQLVSDVENVSPSASVDILAELSLRVNVSIAHFHQIIGVILRSTNARNSFEPLFPRWVEFRVAFGDDSAIGISVLS